MPSLHTASLPCPALDTHEHGWDVESRHATSDGMLLYIICAVCGARRVDLRPNPQLPPFALSVTTPGRV